MASATQGPPTPTQEQWTELCQSVKGTLLEELGGESWYLVIVS